MGDSIPKYLYFDTIPEISSIESCPSINTDTDTSLPHQQINFHSTSTFLTEFV